MTGELVTTASVADFVRASKADNTRKAYASDWQNFERWCRDNDKQSLPAEPETIATYLAALAATRKFATIRRRTAALGFAHRAANFENPLAHAGVRATLEGIARKLGRAPVKKAALTAELLAKAVRKLPADGPGLRDRALLLLGFAGALRRSELVALDVLDLARHPKGLLLTLRKSKTDQAGKGSTKAIPYGKRLHVVEAVDAWLIHARIVDGPIFRPTNHNGIVLGKRLTAGQVARIVKKRCAAIELDPKAFSGHSLRSGYITSAAEHGASLAKIADQAGHAKLDTTRGYVQVADAFKDHSGTRFL
jgi:site-specific recombinase XerD